ncbi:hypothetical protein BU24DRAFT_345737 [Aaosphaeria arxii CBS 175.79]|uniref:Transcription initiation factor TFIID subunit 1 histone acetyltransferase domain-containing protein n=1 Tax=Aaosphaeria arxii CBS 175.79 TaxID=1450172 RepID=A0A6A5XZL3_9PLEO|nr:uncharacterized protein BU24DRAFT_345737 [Aaosphaeria arxii CBS 175.79]KAF2018396.1 hypothetical protein BU24DRAFT_345737 [Aaosphaeria arxii CBS 175.79]
MNIDLDALNDQELDVGEKADDAIDYEDISDDDLPDEEMDDANAVGQLSGSTVQDGHEEDDDLEDLFGGSDPVDEPAENDETQEQQDGDADDDAAADDTEKTQTNFRTVDYGAMEDSDDDDPEWREQKALFQAAARKGADDGLPPPPQTSKEYFDRIWPNFEPGRPPRFFSLIPRKRAFFVPRTPLKPPKPMQLNKINLEIEPDQEKAFRLPSTAASNKTGRQLEEEQRGIVYITDGIEEVEESGEEMDLDDLGDVDEEEKIGNVSWNDLKIACEDWDAIATDMESDHADELLTPPDTLTDDSSWIRDLAAPPAKRRRLGDRAGPIQFSVYDQIDLPSWDDPELATAKISKKIILDMNDPNLLLDVSQATAEPQKPRASTLGMKRDNRGSLANPMFKRYNISNDEAYDALKENSQQKVRATLTHTNVEHSLPALKLQYPFYKVNLADRELRSFHRPTINFKPGERVSISPLKTHIKRKHKKNLKPSDAFAVAEDLNIGDSSDLLLAEYSEEYPTTLSNFGMSNKIVNYYRRKDEQDTSRPKKDLGETSILLPQDKSPFSIFGYVDPGQTVPTLVNSLYRAPVFSHGPKPTDFLVSRSHTGTHGSHYYMRNIQNLVVVGQQFPLVEVPGTHARKVTEASKKRLKMLSFRLYRKGQQKNARQPWVSNEMIKHHLPGTEIAQNRSRMREIMKYEKETGTWRPQDGEVIPEEPALRSWIKPEDICLIDSMHAGDKHLTDAGFKAQDIKDDEDGDAGENTELKLAPWHTTKNFLNACQGKAMLELHGVGDPTGRGEGFSFIKVSMKGGFRDVGESLADKLDAKKLKENGGHSYNVKRQDEQYSNAINRIWNKQADSLSSTMEHSDVEMDDNVDVRQEQLRGRTPRSEFGTPALMRDDETMSQFSRNSANDAQGKVLRIKRWVKNKYDETEVQVQTITDPEVIRLYTKRKRQEQLEAMTIDKIQPTGNAEFDAQQKLKLQAELARLRRNVERREGREKAKGLHNSQTGGPGAGKGGATPRKCANCGEVGHIKTNKK